MSALTRANAGLTEHPPVRVVHLGLGIFHRTHQAWYTHRANQLGSDLGSEGGSGGESSGGASIAAFTGRRPDAALPLQAQDGLYHVLVRDRDGDHPELISSIVDAVDGTDLNTWCRYVADPAVGCITLTVTEAGYRRGPDGMLDRSDPDVAWDIALPGSEQCNQAARTAPGRLVQGLAARAFAGAGPIAVASCDNLVDNGPTCRRVVLDLAAAVDADLATWIEHNVSFVSTMVDRITPKTTTADLERVHGLTGFEDTGAVVTEPFTEWVLSGDFPAGRPDWQLAGARFVPDVRPFEQRKLWLLNGAHSLLAYAGAARGHTTVSDALADPVCNGWVEQWWDEACRHLSLPSDELTRYRAALSERFANPAIRHLLSQIQADGSQKMPIRVLPVIARERAIGVLPYGGVVAIAGWLGHLRDGTTVADPRAQELTDLVRGSIEAAARRLLLAADPHSGLADDAELVHSIARCYRTLSA